MPVDEPKTVEEEIDNSLDESFPASDPPSWSQGKKHDSSLPKRAEPEPAEPNGQESAPD